MVHDLQRDLCRKVTASRGDMAVRQLLFLQLKVELMAHAAAEERHLYVPLLMEDGGLDASRHALHEHHQIDELLEDLSVRDKQQDGWIATAKSLSFKVRHHLKEEEAKFFDQWAERAREAHYLRPHRPKPQRQPRALEAVVPGDEHAPARPEARIYSHSFHGGSPESHSSSR